jgi:hypothetical protein
LIGNNRAGIFWDSGNLGEKHLRLVAFSLVECVAVWALKVPVPHTDVLKPTRRKCFSPKSLEAQNRTVITYYEDEVSPDEMVMCC